MWIHDLLAGPKKILYGAEVTLFNRIGVGTPKNVMRNTNILDCFGFPFAFQPPPVYVYCTGKSLNTLLFLGS